MATATWQGAVIARSDDTVEVDGYVYFPLTSVTPGVLQETATKSVCTFKGTASYYTLSVAGQDNVDAGWSYLDPHPGVEQVRGRIGFWKGVVVTP